MNVQPGEGLAWAKRQIICSSLPARITRSFHPVTLLADFVSSSVGVSRRPFAYTLCGAVSAMNKPKMPGREW